MEWQKQNSTTFYLETKYLKLVLTIDRIIGQVDASLICDYAKIPYTGLDHFGDPYNLRDMAKNRYKSFASFAKAKTWIENQSIKKEKEIEYKSSKHFDMVQNKTKALNMKENNRIRAAKNRLNKIDNEAESIMG